MSISEEAKTFIEIMEGNIVHKIGSDVLRKNHMEDDKDSFKTVSNRIARKMSGEENDQQINDMQSLTENDESKADHHPHAAYYHAMNKVHQASKAMDKEWNDKNSDLYRKAVNRLRKVETCRTPKGPDVLNSSKPKEQMNDMQSLAEEFAKVVLEEYYEKQRKKMMKDTSQMNPETVSTETPRGRNINKYSIDAVGKRLQKDFLQGQVKNWTDKGLGDSGMVQKTKEKLRELSGRDDK